MGALAARVRNGERMMTEAVVTRNGIEMAFADGCRGVVPFADIPEIGNLPNLADVELPNPYQVVLRDSGGRVVELPWDFVRHYCDPAYRPRVVAISEKGAKALGTHIRTLRVAAGVTQAQLAGASQIGRVTLARIESGGQSPRYETLTAIAQGLGRTVAELLGGDWSQ